MSRGKRICAELKQIRRTIAEENGIPLEIPECTYQGECRGTCPRCESEVRYLERELMQRIKMGRVATVAGVAVSLASLTACGGGEIPPYVLPGEMPAPADSIVQISKSPNLQISKSHDTFPVVGGDLIISQSDTSAIDDDVMCGGYDEDFPYTAYTVCDEPPEFPGGTEALYEFFQANIQYPEKALANHIEGKVYVTFIIETDGSISFSKVLRDIGGGCGLEALRVVRSMPRWKPGKRCGEIVSVQYNLPISFTLPEE